MSALTDAIDALLASLDEAGLAPPSRDVRVIEVPARVPVDDRGRLLLLKSQLLEPSEYADRFAALMESRPPWINMSCYGVLDGMLIVAVEIADKRTSPSPSTSVNFSGPARAVLDANWDANVAVSLA